MANTSISEKPWSDYTAADYSVEQWHNACLIHQHDGPPTSKSQCKIPIKIPTGTLNRNGVHAAAAALAGARGGVNTSAEKKASAMKQLRSAYSKLGEKPPPSMMQSEKVENFLAHWGIKGMRWGIRRSDEELDSGQALQEKLDNDPAPKNVDAPVQKEDIAGRSGVTNTDLHYQDYMTKEGHIYTKFSDGTHRLTINNKKLKHDDGTSDLTHWGIKGMRWGIRRSDEQIARDNGAAADAIRARATQTAINKAGLSAVSDSDLNQLVSRINLEKRYADATANTSSLKKGASFIKKATVGTGATMNSAIAFYRSPAGQLIRKKLGR